VSRLLKEWSDAAEEKDTFGKTPLHWACEKSASFEIVSLLLKAHPEAARIKDNDGLIPLHYECENGASIDIVSLLLDVFPEAAMEKDDEDRTALHFACIKRTLKETEQQAGNLQFAPSNHPSFETVSLLVEKYPFAITEEDYDSNSPLDYWNEHHSPDHDERIATILYGIDNLHHDDLDPSIALHIIEEFIQFDWWAGVALAFDLCSSAVEMLDDIPTAAVPTLLSVLVRRCKKLTIWNFIIERQDILKID